MEETWEGSRGSVPGGAFCGTREGVVVAAAHVAKRRPSLVYGKGVSRMVGGVGAGSAVAGVCNEGVKSADVTLKAILWRMDAHVVLHVG